MAGHLLVITVGPIQDFIAAARRTRDLWSGSTLLSDISREVAKSVAGQQGALIFPAQATADNVANIILAELPDGADPKTVAEKAEADGKAHWDGVAADTLRDWAASVDGPRFRAQQGTCLEFYYAWEPLPDDPEAYQQARRKLMQVLNGRKACRNFNQFTGVAKLPKSSLDGARESVWKDGKLGSMTDWRRKQLRLNDGEQLDAIGLIKRAGLGNRQFPSVSRIAADPWLRGLDDKDRALLIADCEELVKDKVGLISLARFHQYADFPYEGSAVFERRLDEVIESEAAEGRQTALRKRLKALYATYNEPSPYLAVLVADGDRVGKTISGLRRVSDNRRFSDDLAHFAREAKKIVEAHHGVLVYAGGDDVLAFLPANKAIECARALRDEFARRMEKWPGPTLSVGLAFGHCMEDLEDLLQAGRAAEKDAKEDRNALAVHWKPAGGPVIKVRRSWETKPDHHLLELLELYYHDRFPDGAAYQLREMARHYQDWRVENPHRELAMQVDARRLLSRKASGKTVNDAVQNLLQTRLKTPADLLEFANEMIIARRLVASYRQRKQPPVKVVSA